MKTFYFTKFFQFLNSLFFKKINNSNKTKSRFINEELYGKVKSIRIMNYNIADKFGEIIKDIIRINSLTIGDEYYNANMKIFFNKNGEGLEYNWYDSDGELESKQKYNKKDLYDEYTFYNSKGDITEMSKTEYDDKGTKIHSKHYNSEGNLDYIFKNNEKGQNIEFTNYNSNGTVRDLNTYKYNEYGKQTEKKTYEPDENGTLQLKYTFDLVYDEKRNLIRESRYYPNGYIFYEHNYKYDDNNNLLEHIDHFQDKYIFKYDINGKEIEKIWYRHQLGNKLLKTFKSKYDENGNKIENITYNSEGNLIFKETYKYDENGNIICYTKFEPDRGYDFKISYKYDINRNVIQSKHLNSEGNSNYENTFKFKFDKKNNWIERIKYEYGRPKYMIERNIEYY